uniref:Chitin-binding type-2 domain-containing protein n=1 Tax=Anopheles culicifacies TaxID=139723 RepID=A0A182MGT2_9DIPT
MRLLYSIVLFVVIFFTTTNAQTAEPCVAENELTANPHICNQYYRCLSGERIAFGCTAGKVFNPSTKTCVASDAYLCDDHWSEMLTTPAPSVYCAVNKNAIVAHLNDCRKYVLCEDGVEQMHTCPEGEQFSWKKLACGVDFPCAEYFEGQGNSLEAVACARQPLQLAEHPYDVGMYVDCNEEKHRNCEDGTIFRWNYQRCLPGVVSTNELKSASANCGAFGKSSHPYLCEKFFKCFFWISSLNSCPVGMIYSATLEECIPAVCK